MSSAASRGGTRLWSRVTLGEVISGAVLLLIVAVAVGQLVGQPFILGFVETGSMQPTMDPGDGFVAVPPALVGGVEVGDVITYRAVEIGGGGLTTHRVVEVTDTGFVTAGDANAFTDQAGGEPPVSRSRVVAVAVQVGGQVIVIPELGSLIGALGDGVSEVQSWLAGLLGTRSVLGIEGLGLLLLAASIVGYVFDVALAKPEKPRRRPGTRDGGYRISQLVLVAGLLLAVVATVVMVAPSGATVYPFDSVDPGATVEGGIPRGTASTVETTVTNTGLVPMFVVFDADNPGLAVPSDPVLVWPQQERTVDITITAPTTTGRYMWTAAQHRYLAVLPAGVLGALHAVDPWAAILAVDAIVVAGVVLVGRVVLGRGRVKVRGRQDRRSRWRIRAWLYGDKRHGD